jgi:hypothetical protein
VCSAFLPRLLTTHSQTYVPLACTTAWPCVCFARPRTAHVVVPLVDMANHVAPREAAAAEVRRAYGCTATGSGTNGDGTNGSGTGGREETAFELRAARPVRCGAGLGSRDAKHAPRHALRRT